MSASAARLTAHQITAFCGRLPSAGQQAEEEEEMAERLYIAGCEPAAKREFFCSIDFNGSSYICKMPNNSVCTVERDSSEP